jgi:hypothetical protein
MRISSSTPPASPAATMLRNRSSKTFLCLPSASASVAPASTSCVTSPITRPNEGLLACLARMSRHWTSGRPAEIMVANWRVKMARSLVVTPLPPPSFGSLKPPAFGRIEVTRIFFLRSRSMASSWRPTSISPLCDSPASVRPFQTKTGMGSSYATFRWVAPPAGPPQTFPSIPSSSDRSPQWSNASSGLRCLSSTACRSAWFMVCIPNFCPACMRL